MKSELKYYRMGNYSQGLCEKIASNYDITTMTIEYFCYHSRPNVGGKLSFSAQDLAHIDEIVNRFNLDNAMPLDKKLDLINEISRQNNIISNIFCMIEPQNGEYQNFGLLPALDIINAINDAKQSFGLGNTKIILLGSSYGGYIANMVEKIAPGMIDAIIDNSSWALPNMKYLIGRELNHTEFTQKLESNLMMHMYTKSPWTLTGGLPNTLTASRIKIRSFDIEQTHQMINQGGGECYYVFYHGMKDHISPVKEKLDMIFTLKKVNKNNLIYKMITNESQIDGSLIKTLEHGFGMSMMECFKVHFQEIRERIIHKKRNRNMHIEYKCDDLTYRFDHSRHPVKVSISSLEAC